VVPVRHLAWPTFEPGHITPASPVVTARVDRSVRPPGEHCRVMREAGRLQALDVRTGEELIGRALERLLRGGTWEGVANEIAWKAVNATGARCGCVEWLSGLVEAHLSERVDGLVFALEPECRAARESHLRRWPHDLAGAETAVCMAGEEAARQQISRLYVEVLEWACGLLEDRIAREPTSLRSRLRSLRSGGPPAETQLPEPVAEGLTAPPRYGWQSRPSDGELIAS
jgi:hypothetical protein